MSKQTTRAFASGLLISSLILYVYVHFFQKKPEPVQAIKEGYMEIKEHEYEQLKLDSEEWQKKYESLAKKKSEEVKKTEPIEKHFQLVITEGMSSKEICSQLEDAGLIDDAEDFNDYLANQNLQRYIQIGTYDLNDSMSYEDISSIIAKDA
ncbi:endolytic transglycosylase MltG [Bacillus sp. FJAT-49711]|uniref:endolytic transglycosylase MltG n=1 Tax=Bacillus sp. FJAT-49711 TaxID=2833585 RepID=UPI001BC94B5B|nr:endolytic transglycosylase MltG [Bacillus sp. FJAT-49711]MBS4217145.1 endolytic transglycosylase MltG [Bacillus sp. FJAT-49711]